MPRPETWINHSGMLHRTWLSITLPIGVLACAGGLLWWPSPWSSSYLAALNLVLYLTFGVGLLLSWSFDRSRVFFLLLILLLTAIGLAWLGAFQPRTGPQARIFYACLCLFAPFAIFGLGITNERGILTRHGLLRWLLIAVLVGLTLALTATENRAAVRYFEFVYVSFTQTPLTPLPQRAVLMFLLAGAGLIGRSLLKGSLQEVPMLAALLGLGLALHTYPDTKSVAVMLTASALALILGVLQESYHMAFLDELTGLPGRRALRAQTLKLGERYAIAMLDVDHFKKFNDTYGHDAGDQVLRLVAAQMARATGGGKAFRYGGEEFTLVFPGRRAEESLPFLEALRQSIAQTPFVLRDKDRPKQKPPADSPRTNRSQNTAKRSVSVTVSIGVAEPTDDLATPDTVMKAADAALYRAKNNGRNQVSL